MSRRSSRNGVLIPGLILIAVGAWFLAGSLGVELPNMEQMWPVFPTVVGISLFIGWLVSSNKRGNYGMIIPAAINFLIGIFFFGFTFELFPWSDMAIYWPVFPLIVGVAFIAAWLFSGLRDTGLLIPGGVAAAVGIVGLGFTVFGMDETVRDMLDYWPVLLIVLGVLILIGGLLGSKRRSSEGGTSSQDYKGPDGV